MLKGRVIKGKSSSGIFLPFAGAYPFENEQGFPLQGYGELGAYWTSTCYSEVVNNANSELYAYFISLLKSPFVNVDLKANGLPVRPVCK